MGFGMKPNGYKNNISQIMPNKVVSFGLSFLVFSLLSVSACADEVLGHISDDTEPTIQQSPAASANSDRKIIYRVICSPNEEQLPDCEKPFHDVEADNKPQPSQESADQADQVEKPSNSEADEKSQPAKPVSKAANKKQDKSSKKPAGKKDKQASKSSATQKSAKKELKKPPAKKASVKKK